MLCHVAQLSRPKGLYPRDWACSVCIYVCVSVFIWRLWQCHVSACVSFLNVRMSQCLHPRSHWVCVLVWVCRIWTPLVVITGNPTVSLLTSVSWLHPPNSQNTSLPNQTAPYHIGKYNTNIYPHCPDNTAQKTLKQTPKWVHTLTNHHWWILKVNRDHPSVVDLYHVPPIYQNNLLHTTRE